MEGNRITLSAWLIILLIPFAIHAGTIKQNLHPRVLLLDKNGTPVIRSGQPVSSEKTCGACHDYQYITAHSYHAQQGKNEFFNDQNRPEHFPGYVLSPGMFGKWCSMPNRLLASHGVVEVEDFDLGTPEWLQKCGTCHVGGGPSQFDRQNRKLDSVDPNTVDAMDPDYHYYDSRSGALKTWDWRKSGVMEMDCFLCHIPNFDRVNRDEMLRSGNFKWAVTATLGKTGIVSKTKTGWKYNAESFDSNGCLKDGQLDIIDPEIENCAQCHGFGQSGRGPINPFYSKNLLRGTLKMGRVFSPDLISSSNINIKGKDSLNYSWDVHAERLLKCTNCHYSLDNPAYQRKDQETRLEHLIFDPRTLDAKDYLKRPSHEFAKGNSCPENVADHLDGTMRRCEDCHDASTAHSWLPYPEHHFKKVGCETCHIPDKKMWAFKTADWTVLALNGKFIPSTRGIEGSFKDPKALVTGFKPAILPRITQSKFSPYKLMPYNLITAMYWYDAEKQRPVFTRILKGIYLTKNEQGKTTYRKDIVEHFDQNKDGKLTTDELQINTREKYEFIASKLKAAGVGKPEIHSEIVPFSINHNVVPSEHAIRDCQVCHSTDSRLFQPLKLADYIPPNTQMKYAEFCAACPDVDQLTEQKQDGVYFNPTPLMSCYYIIGHDRIEWVEIAGILSIFFSVIGVIGHDIFRVIKRGKK